MEKRHFNSKTIRNLKIETDKKISTDSEILDEAKKYYESLYMSITNSHDVDNCENIFFPEVNETKLSYNQKESCEGLLSQKECFESLKTEWNPVSPLVLMVFQQNFTKCFGTICHPFYSPL